MIFYDLFWLHKNGDYESADFLLFIIVKWRHLSVKKESRNRKKQVNTNENKTGFAISLKRMKQGKKCFVFKRFQVTY